MDPYGYGPDDEAAAAGYSPEALKIAQAMAQFKMRQAQNMMNTPTAAGATVGRTYVAASPLEHLVNAMTRVKGGMDMRNAEQGYQPLMQQAQAGEAARFRLGRADKNRDYALREGEANRRAAHDQSAQALAEAQAMAREADAVRDAKHQAEQLALQREGLGLKRKELDMNREAKAAADAEKARGAKSKAAEDLRKEFQGLQTYKNTQTVAETYRKIQNTAETGPGDMSLIFSYMKMLDPGSTVREGEYATAQNAGSVPQNIVAAYNRAVGGEKLAPDVRKQFRDQARSVLKAQSDRYEETAKPYRRLAEQSGVSPDDVVLDLGLKGLLEPAPVAGAVPSNGSVRVQSKAERDALPPGTQYVGPDGVTYTKR